MEAGNMGGMERELRSLAVVSSSVALSLCYCYYLSSRISPGTRRLLSLIPVLYLFTQLPLSFSTVHLGATFAFIISWLSVFKLLLFSFQRGPLSDPTLSLPAFFALASLPVKINNQNRQLPNKEIFDLEVSPHVVSALKVALLASIISYYPERHRYPRPLVVAAYTVHVYLALDLVLGTTAVIAACLLGTGGGVAMEPQFQAPYLSSSLQDFWGRRWNLMVTRLLHQAVYAPVRTRCGPLAGVMAAFLVSGLVHEVMVYYLTLRWATGEATCYFLLQGASMAAEAAAKGVLGKKGWVVPRTVAAPVTVAYVWGTAMVLLFPALLRGGELEEAVVGECMAIIDWGRAVTAKAKGVALFFSGVGA